MPLVSFYTLKTLENQRLSSGGTERNQWYEMGYLEIKSNKNDQKTVIDCN